MEAIPKRRSGILKISLQLFLVAVFGAADCVFPATSRLVNLFVMHGGNLSRLFPLKTK